MPDSPTPAPSSGQHAGLHPSQDEILGYSSLNISEILHSLHEKMWIIAGCVFFAILLGGVYILRSETIYASTTTVQVEQEEQRVVKIENVIQQDLKNTELVRTIEQNLASRALLRRVVESLGLIGNKDFLSPLSGGKKRTIGQVLDSFSPMMSVSLRRGTRLIDVTVEHPDPKMAQNLSSEIVHQYILMSMEQRSETSFVAAEFLQREEKRLREKMIHSEQLLQEYKEKTQLVSLEESQNIIVERLKELNKQLTEAEAELTALVERYKHKHPKMVQARSNVEMLRANLERQEKKALELNKQSIEYKALSRVAEADRALHENVLRRLQEMQVASGVTRSEIRIVEPAMIPENPIKPRKSLIMALAFGGGLFAGLGLVLTLHYIDNTIKTVDQAEKTFGLPVIGAIPLSKSIKQPKDGLLSQSDQKCAVAESFRTLRANVALLGRQSERKSFIFTSAVPGEGKSFSCANFAIVSAQKGIKTLLIDADLRRPSMLGVWNMEEEKNQPGITDFLVGEASLEQAVCKTGVENLSLLRSGRLAPNPAEILTDKWFRDLLDKATKAFDRVIVDTAPINAVSDTLLMVHHVSTVIMVVHAGKTPVNATSRALGSLARIGVKPAGLVVNRLPSRSGMGYSYYYYYSHHEGYGKEGVYGAT